MTLLVGIDIGGTFTDVVTLDTASGALYHAKRPSYPDDLVRGIRQALADDAIPLADVGVIRHGTTVVINAILQRNGARTALVTTEGFRDVLEIGRTNRPETYNVFYDRDPPLVPRELRFEVGERLGADGSVVRALVRPDVVALCQRMPDDLEALAVCLLHSYVNPDHEIEVALILREERPSLHISMSHELSREFREYERTSTVVLNAYVAPVVDRYLENLDRSLGEDGFTGSLYLMESSGGVTSVADARRRPIVLIESGPAAGAIAVATYAQRQDMPRAIAFDMGGTSAKAALVEGGEPLFSSEYYVPTYDRGFPIHVAAVDLVEVGTGGGSIASIDEVGAMSVGPRSAQAVPGPACYGLGGSEPTVTDANLVLGRLSAEAFLGGQMKLDVAAATAAIESVAAATDLSTEEFAEGIVRLANINMADAIRRVSLERGRDPREFALFAYGGAGPLHAAALARELAIPTVVIPPVPGVWSAFGMLLADLRHDFGVTVMLTLDEAGMGALEDAFLQVESEAALWRAGAAVTGTGANERTLRFAECRYKGQAFAITIAADIASGESAVEVLRTRFEVEYEHRYGHAFPELFVEIVTARAVTYIALEKPDLDLFAPTPDGGVATKRGVYFHGHGVLSTSVYQRTSLAAGETLVGPAVIEEYGATTVVFPGDRLRVDESGLLAITIGEDQAA
jgi:N-methylhydantoinase A